ncbi:L1 [Leptonychotes weddellii papillomavirus 2]|uniref:Major capsid protein L1 n=1 Tax=Leptonychotes weddellii papillomavirus 2 TaxID=2077303 RepID=A0A2I8B2N0_9PAPI|nr:L1 [Leptonychotes weddellii papillomavirus 2]AUT11894.1 L1 [Leptonychotes weddellii papillomavirus 2]
MNLNLWKPSTGRVYFPPAQPVSKVLSTDDYVTNTNLFFHAHSDRLLTVGHPFYAILNEQDEEPKVKVPKVSGNQFRVFRFTLPDPNKFALIDQTTYNSEKERLVWKLVGLDIFRGGPLGIGSTGHPLMNRLTDTENPSNKYQPITQQNTLRNNISVDPKQTQLFIVGCEPSIGCHWDKAKACENAVRGSCPPLELKHTEIQDGEMCDIGFGNLNFKDLQVDRSGVPLDCVSTICKWPDFTQMSKDIYGNRMFFYGKREQLFARHLFCRDGELGEPIPGNNTYYLAPDTEAVPEDRRRAVGSCMYFSTPSGSLVTSDSQVFNRPYWLHRAQGTNNGMCWGNNLFITIMDNTRNTNFTISVKTNGEDLAAPDKQTTPFKHYIRHTEEFDFEMIFQLCKVELVPDVLAHINAMDSNILDEWNLSFIPPPVPTGIDDAYRFLSSLATKCPLPENAEKKKGKYDGMVFWEVDLREKFSSELDQHSLGRRFLYQSGLLSNGKTNKRLRTDSTSSSKSKKKRK